MVDRDILLKSIDNLILEENLSKGISFRAIANPAKRMTNRPGKPVLGTNPDPLNTMNTVMRKLGPQTGFGLYTPVPSEVNKILSVSGALSPYYAEKKRIEQKRSSEIAERIRNPINVKSGGFFDRWERVVTNPFGSSSDPSEPKVYL